MAAYLQMTPAFWVCLSLQCADFYCARTQQKRKNILSKKNYSAPISMLFPHAGAREPSISSGIDLYLG